MRVRVFVSVYFQTAPDSSLESELFESIPPQTVISLSQGKQYKAVCSQTEQYLRMHQECCKPSTKIDPTLIIKNGKLI